ncbi:hypothetical protein [Defluviitalea phaphyphila]|uniref:hypothetical protein n=1 Tax=Defluviitalea phaphyphila TaxID=1473580 RepID=UPI00073028A8|nr:hypothetical protein [Defluviitalea phaphyphila]
MYKYKKLIFNFLFFLIFFIYPVKAYGTENKIILLISSESSWDKWLDSSFISHLIPQSAVGTMSIRTNHKNKEIEFYGTIATGKKWNYYEINNMGAVEKGVGDLVTLSNFSTAFFSKNENLKKIIENSLGETSYTTNNFTKLYSKKNIDILDNSDLILIEMDLYNTKENLDFLINYIKENNVILYVFSPYDKGNTSTLTPFLFYNGKNPEHGLISSYTTRRKGIITNIDIAPTILKQLGLSNNNMISQGIKVYPNKNSFFLMMKQLDKIKYINYFRPLMIKIYIILLISFLIIFLIIYKINNNLITKIFNATLLSVLWVPIIFMINFNIKLNPVYIFLTALIILTCAILIINYFYSYKIILLITSGSILIILILDTIAKSVLQQNSFLGYDPMIGARFYGIGNEYAGVIIGNLYLFLYCIYDWTYFKKIALLFQTIVLFIFSMPFWGANVGGTISLLLGMSVFIFKYYKHKYNKVIYIFLALTIFGLFWISIDYFFVKEKSHFAQTLYQSINGNFQVLIEILQRKFIMNIQLIKYSMWSKFLIISLIILAFYFDINNKIIKSVGSSVIGAMIGAIIFNDSGIVMTAICMIYIVFPYLYVYNHSNKVIQERTS